jgi:hypothetical protein
MNSPVEACAPSPSGCQPVVRATGRHDAHRHQALKVDLGRAQMLVAERVLDVLERDVAQLHVHRSAVAHPEQQARLTD